MWTSDLPRRRVFSNIITFALDLYSTTGISLRTVASKLRRFFHVNITHEGVREWVRTLKKPLPKSSLHKPSRWHVDETHIKIKGKGYWLWIVYCRDSGYVLSWHVSKTRTIKHAKKVLRQARTQTGIRPRKITSDGLPAYVRAIKKVMGWYWREYKKRHVIDSGIGKNWVIERVNREVKRRTRWLDSFQSLEGTRSFFHLYFYHFNLKDP